MIRTCMYIYVCVPIDGCISCCPVRPPTSSTLPDQLHEYYMLLYPTGKIIVKSSKYGGNQWVDRPYTYLYIYIYIYVCIWHMHNSLTRRET